MGRLGSQGRRRPSIFFDPSPSPAANSQRRRLLARPQSDKNCPKKRLVTHSPGTSNVPSREQDPENDHERDQMPSAEQLTPTTWRRDSAASHEAGPARPRRRAITASKRGSSSKRGGRGTSWRPGGRGPIAARTRLQRPASTAERERPTPRHARFRDDGAFHRAPSCFATTLFGRLR